jgi:triosephosphate isomerase
MNRAFPTSKRLVVGNWKMNPDSFDEAKKIFETLKKKNLRLKKTIVAVCPPTIYEFPIVKNYIGNVFKFGLQDIHYESNDTSTGYISIEMAKTSKVEYVIVGHSERRENGENNAIVSLKLKKVVSANINAILCVGEKERDEQGTYLRFIEQQLHESLSSIKKNDASKLVIAYEPIWAIGTGETCEAEEANRVIGLIRSKLKNPDVSIQYGGSVKPDNIDEIMAQPEIDGALVGGASLKPESFARIVNYQ